MDDMLDTLLANELFRNVTVGELSHLGIEQRCRQVRVDSGATLFTQGHSAETLYLVEQGLVSLRKILMAPVEIPPDQSSIALCGPGEMIGWSAIVPPFRYTLTAVTVSPTTVLTVEGQGLRADMDQHPEIGYKIMKSLAEVVSRRLRQIEVTLVTHQGYAIMNEQRPGKARAAR